MSSTTTLYRVTALELAGAVQVIFTLQPSVRVFGWPMVTFGAITMTGNCTKSEGPQAHLARSLNVKSRFSAVALIVLIETMWLRDERWMSIYTISPSGMPSSQNKS